MLDVEPIEAHFSDAGDVVVTGEAVLRNHRVGGGGVFGGADPSRSEREEE
jgi:hypothetical protein